MLRKLPALTISLLLFSTVVSTAPPSAPPKRIANIEQWLRALVHHTPGHIDDPLRAFSAWSAPDWQNLLSDAQVFAMLLRNPARSDFVLPISGNGRTLRPTYSKDELRRLQLLGCSIGGPFKKGICPPQPPALDADLQELARRTAAARTAGDAYHVLRLAALLHFDLVAWGQTHDLSPTMSSGEPARLWIDVTDGRGSGLRQDGIQWLIAYGVLDPIVSSIDTPPGVPAGARDPWTRDWFVATTLWMQQRGRFDQSHVERALKYFPDDPDVRFLSACQHEIDAGPTMQNAMRSVVLPPIASFWIQSEKQELRDAASDLRRALAVRPDWHEAHLRLGRVLAQLGDTADAAAQLRTALETPDKALQYYALLFLGGVEESDGHLDEAVRRYESARALYPASQSPYLALSALAHRRGDRASALRALQPVLQREEDTSTPDADPWWEYLIAQTRQADSWIAAVRQPYRHEPSP